LSLGKKRTLTVKRIAANPANGERLRGPANPAGREQGRTANTRLGLYSRAKEGEPPSCLTSAEWEAPESVRPLDPLAAVKRNQNKLFREPVKFMKVKQVSEVLKGSRWPV
jgi:hypothetical protein